MRHASVLQCMMLACRSLAAPLSERDNAGAAMWLPWCTTYLIRNTACPSAGYRPWRVSAGAPYAAPSAGPRGGGRSLMRRSARALPQLNPARLKKRTSFRTRDTGLERGAGAAACMYGRAASGLKTRAHRMQ